MVVVSLMTEGLSVTCWALADGSLDAFEVVVTILDPIECASHKPRNASGHLR